MSVSLSLPTIELKITIRADDLLSIGWGYPGLTGTDIQLFRFKPAIDATPIIPGSSIKGSLRTAAIRVAKILGLNVCKEVDPRLISIYCRSDDILLEMFGKPGDSAPSRLIVEPFTTGNGGTMILKHVSINRESLKAEEEALYSSEYITPCTVLEGKLVLNLGGLSIGTASKMLELLLLALLELEDVGLGRGSRKITVLKISIDENVVEELKEKNILTPLSEKILDMLTSDRNKPCIR